jgi:D-alanine-D-alanine ligase
MQKDLAKIMLKAAGVPVPDGVVASRHEAAKKHLLERPYVIKPIAEGSSVGVFIVTDEHEHPPQELFRDDWAFGEQVLCERYIPGKELTCAVMGDRALDVIEIVPRYGFTIMRRNTRRAAPNMSYPLKFYQKFTKRSED